MSYTTIPTGEMSKVKREMKMEQGTNVETFYAAIARELKQDPAIIKEAIKKAFYNISEMPSPQQANYMVLKLMSDSYSD